jgi:hypothetical protein
MSTAGTAMLHRRPRLSTLVLLAVFGGLLALYVIVRPDTGPATGDGSPAGAQPSPAATESRTPSPEPTPSDTPTGSRTPSVSPSPSPSSIEPLPTVTTSLKRG